MHNLGTVFKFEVVRTLKKKSFWIMSLSFPVIIGAVFAVIFFSNQATDQAVEKIKNQQFSIAITDKSGLIKKEITDVLKAPTIADKQTGIDQVKNNKLDAYFYFPQDINKNKIEIYGKDVGLFDNGRYEAVAKIMLEQSVASSVSPDITAILQSKMSISSITYKNGAQYDGYKELIAPGIFLVLFYVLIAMFGNQMLTSTTEEKENRVTEMILTTIEARTLIIGKIFSLIILAFFQIVLIMVPVIIAYIFLHDQLSLPNLDLTNIPLNPVRIIAGAVIFGLSFLLFTGLLVAVGAIAPTAKEAGGFFGVIMLFIFGPLYAISLFVSSPESPIVQFLTFFPLTAPIPLMLRNAVGNLTAADYTISIIILSISAVLMLAVAVRLFRFGVLAYSNMISLKVLFKK